MKKTGTLYLSLWVILIMMFTGCSSEPEWPEISQDTKPWTRWWWHGNSVTEQGLTAAMEEFKQVGLGGVEITPIYGVAGEEDQFINYLSPEWMEKLQFTLQEGQRLNMGVDMATGTGWPFGGPWVDSEDGSKRLVYKKFVLSQNERLSEPVTYIQKPLLRAIGQSFNTEVKETENGTGSIKIEEIAEPINNNNNLQSLSVEQVRFEKALPLLTLMGYSEAGDIVELTQKVRADGELDWIAPEGTWTLFAVFEGQHGKMVERAAPGGEGLVIDHFADAPIENYLKQFDEAFADYDISGLRSYFNDSYEVDDAQGEANWTTGFFEAFKEKRSYDLQNHLPALFGQSSEDKNSRVLSDYRETVSDLLLEKFTRKWKNWANDNGGIIRNQAHGSPANILDLYAASDIPETEGTDIFKAKMASSAANVTGKKLISSEAATWLNEHFLSSLSDVKTNVDRYFLGGVNHIVYHGTAYSPKNEEWPGWLFYAAVHFNPQNPFWDHFDSFNEYVTRVQSFLQSGQPDNDVLLYLPIHDQWAESDYGLLKHFDGDIEDQFSGTSFKSGAEGMLEQGYGFDYISDKQLQQTEVSGGLLETAGGTYKTILLPKSKFLPIETYERVVDLAQQGATIIAYEGLPDNASGYSNLKNKQERFQQLTDQLQFTNTGEGNIQEARIGEGKFLKGDGLEQLLEYAQVPREAMVDKGLRYVRRSHEDGNTYFVINWGEEEVDGWIPLGVTAQSAALYDPMKKESGYAKFRIAENGNPEVYLQLDPGESSILKTYQSSTEAASYPYKEETGNDQELEGNWTVEFTDGGPILPEPVETGELVSWTEFGGQEFKDFSGKATYTHAFDAPGGEVDGWILDLGTVKHSAHVKLNGEDLATLIGPTFQVYIDNDEIKDSNKLEVEVANLMANRVAYMDRRNLPWKKFYNVNFSARRGTNRNAQGIFDASGWESKDSGLIGPVKLIPVKVVE